MPWSNQAVTLIVLFEEDTGFSGLFGYSPAPGNGNLIFSVAATSGTDPFSNSYQAGVVSYGSAGNAAAFAQLIAGALRVESAASSQFQLLASGPPGTSFMWLQHGTGGPPLQISETGRVTGTQPATVATPETWHVMALDGVNFQALPGFQIPRYRYEPTGTGGLVRLDGAIEVLTAQATGAPFFTLPAAYRPTEPHYFLTPNTLSGGSGQIESLRVQTSGQVQLGHSGAATNYLFLDGAVFPLD